MPDNQSNLDILNSIGGVGTQAPQTTLSTGTDTSSAGAMPGADNSMFGNSAGPLQSNMNYLKTIQGLMGNQSFNPYMTQGYAPNASHAIGRDNWSSAIGLDQNAILQNLGIGGQT